MCINMLQLQKNPNLRIIIRSTHQNSSYSTTMGMVLGKIPVETPNFETLHSTPDYEIRKYPPAVAAAITYDPSSQFRGDRDGGFKVLADYIGAFSSPQNARPEKIAMTAPVITTTTTTSPGEKIAMTAPVVTREEKGAVTMQFLLPAKYTKAAEAPAPMDERVVIREEAERKYGAVRFSGAATERVAAVKAEELRKKLERDGYKVMGDHVLARYNPPWLTLPMFRTNDVLIPIH